MKIKPFRIYMLKKYIKRNDLKILDIGSGSHSPSITKTWFSQSTYHAVDINLNYNNDKKDIESIDKFFQKDLTLLDFNDIEDNSYDLIIMSHIIEHLSNGDRVIESLLSKLKPEGIIYIEYPSDKSLSLPSMQETLNFFDDPTHVRVYTLPELVNLLIRNNTKILRCGTRKRLLTNLLIPIKVVYQLLSKGYIRGGTLWDITGFAEYIIARKNK